RGERLADVTRRARVVQGVDVYGLTESDVVGTRRTADRARNAPAGRRRDVVGRVVDVFVNHFAVPQHLNVVATRVAVVRDPEMNVGDRVPDRIFLRTGVHERAFGVVEGAAGVGI